jgi:hypothetical protein
MYCNRLACILLLINICSFSWSCGFWMTLVNIYIALNTVCPFHMCPLFHRIHGGGSALIFWWHYCSYRAGVGFGSLAVNLTGIVPFSVMDVENSNVYRNVFSCYITDIHIHTKLFWSQYSSFGIVTGYGLNGRGMIPSRGKRFFCTPQRSDRLWDPPCLLSNRYRELFPGD